MNPTDQVKRRRQDLRSYGFHAIASRSCQKDIDMDTCTSSSVLAWNGSVYLCHADGGHCKAMIHHRLEIALFWTCRTTVPI